MSKIKTLLAGCSFSDFCGFGDLVTRDGLPAMPIIGNHNDPRCWYNVVKERCNLDLTNVSYGGLSNEEILQRVKKKLATNNYDLVIIQTTSVGRKWLYRSENPFDSVSLWSEHAKSNTELEVLKYVATYFYNEIIETERTLSSLILVKNYLAEKNIPLIICNGLNFGQLVTEILDSPVEMFRPRIPYDLWNTKGYDYAMEMHKLCQHVEINSWIAGSHSWHDMMIDRADDQSHPGQKSNLLYADQVEQRIQMAFSS